MQAKEIETVIVGVLREVQTTSGRLWSDLNPDSRPLGDLEGFDSLTAVEVTVAVEQKLSCRFEIESIFASDDGKRALSLRQIGERIGSILDRKERSK